MEEVMSMIFHGLELVKELESSLPEKSPERLKTSLDEISKAFGDANEQLKMLLETKNDSNQTKPVIVSGSNQMLMHIEPGLMHEYLQKCGGSTSSQVTGEMIQSQLMAVDGGGGSSTPRQRRRKNQGEEHTVLVSALRMGNIDMLPDDNHTWRKYGQKEILGSRFPRAYYRCTHQKLYNCSAKKQVQRLDEDPFTFRVTYRGSHACHIYSTAPTATTTAPISSAATTAYPIDYGPAILDMTESMFGSGGIGANIDSIYSLNDPPQKHQRFWRLDDGESGGDQ